MRMPDEMVQALREGWEGQDAKKQLLDFGWALLGLIDAFFRYLHVSGLRSQCARTYEPWPSSGHPNPRCGAAQTLLQFLKCNSILACRYGGATISLAMSMNVYVLIFRIVFRSFA